ncbi:MAG TPA: hypothetical protein VM841_00270 [Actinomycetota bacterium]|nr:hypothetical protein [Actinomycetota bacterium]
MRKILVTAVLAGAFWLGGSLPVWACSCAGSGPPVHFDHADAVFVASLENRRDPNGDQTIISSADPIDYEMYVESVQKGDVAEQVVVRSARNGASCGFTFVRGIRYQIFARQDGDRFLTSLCEGTAVLGAQVYEPNGSDGPARTGLSGEVGPPPGEAPGRAKPLAGAVAGLLIAGLGVALARAARRSVS